MELKEIALELREILENKRQELELTFIEDTHTYFMKDVDGVVKNNFPSVSKVLKKFYPEFPTDECCCHDSLELKKTDLKLLKL